MAEHYWHAHTNDCVTAFLSAAYAADINAHTVMKPWLDKAHSTMTAIWFYYSLKKDLFSYILIICGASSAFFKWRTQRVNFCSQNDTYTHTRTHFPWCTLSVLSQFISLGPNSYIHANKQAFISEARSEMKPQRRKSRGICLNMHCVNADGLICRMSSVYVTASHNPSSSARRPGRAG